jgi:hypothetical protein
MPCSVSKEEEEFYEKSNNKKLYGLKELSSRITERVACELSRLIEDAGFQSKLSSVAVKWIERHKEEDAKRGAKK